MLSSFFISVLLLSIAAVHSFNTNRDQYHHHLQVLTQATSDKQPIRVVNLLDKLRSVNLIKRRLDMTSNLIPFGWGPGGRRLTRGEMRLYGCLLAVRDRIRRDGSCNEILPSLAANAEYFSSFDHGHAMPRM